MRLDLMDLNTDLELIRNKLDESRKCIQPDEIPELLFHYTNSNGLLGILSSSRLWATNYRFLNDSSEITYGASIFQSVVDELLKSTDDKLTHRLLELARETTNLFEGMFDFYVSCFCERDDLLNQWRVYTESGGGYALGLAPKQLGARWKKLQPNQDFFLRKVIYNETEQRKLIEEILSSTILALSKAAKETTEQSEIHLVARCVQFIRSATAEYLMCFKHPAFEVEQEWRLCHITDMTNEEHIQFRDGPYGLTPYIALDPTPSAGIYTNKLPLIRITHGPTTDASNVRFALTKLLQTKKYSFAEISGSVLPVRVSR